MVSHEGPSETVEVTERRLSGHGGPETAHATGVTPESPPARIPRVLGSTSSVGDWLKDLWDYRDILVALSARDLRGKYKQALLGAVWSIVQPVTQVGLFTFVFQGVAHISTPVPYRVFALAALLPFNLFQQIVTKGTPGFVVAQGIVTKVYFPRLYTVAAASASALVNAAITLVLLALALVWFRHPVSTSVLLTIPILAGVLLLGLGGAALLGAINARFRDVQHALPLLMTLLLFVSPVLYPLTEVPASVRTLAMLNPVSGLVDGFRAAVLGAEPYSRALVWTALAVSVGIFVIGVSVFERTQAKLIDVL